MPVERRNNWSVGLSLSLTIAAMGLGCAAKRSVLPDCVIERPSVEVMLEQAAEADRAAAGGQPLNPATYEWLKRADRDLGLFGDPE